MTSATDNRTTELKAINRIISTLRERGVQFATHGNTDRVWWTTENGVTWYAQDRPNANDLFVKLEAVLTPEQAIAATLGSGTCEPKWTLQGKTQTQEFWRCDCGNCGHEFGIEIRESYPLKMTVGKVDVPNFCPNCGRKVVSE